MIAWLDSFHYKCAGPTIFLLKCTFATLCVAPAPQQRRGEATNRIFDLSKDGGRVKNTTNNGKPGGIEKWNCRGVLRRLGKSPRLAIL